MNINNLFNPSIVYAADSIGDDSGDAMGNASTSFIGLNPIKKSGLDSLSGIISELLPYLLTIAGLILFGMLIIGGFQMMTAGTDAKAADAGKTRITQAIIGFIIIFAAYWIAQIVEVILGVNILK